MTKIFVASPIDVYMDDAAAAKLALVNDSRFTTSQGILKVDEARWKEAQKYERDTWLLYNLDAVSDRNELHAAGFNNYAALPQALGDYAELGCGPFTNSRLILPGHAVTSVTLVDPLVDEFRRIHPHCTYRDGMLDSHPVTTVASAIEEWKPETKYNTVVMTNVLPHCYDAAAVFEKIRQILAPGGWLVFHECAREPAPLEHYDVGHPLIVTEPVINEFLSGFEPVWRSGPYFIGYRKAAAPVVALAAEPETTPKMMKKGGKR